jgi:hypothetical protein
MVARRAVLGAAVLAFGASAIVLWLGKPWTAFALILTAAVGMISGLWLEVLLAQVLQPGKPRITRWAVLLWLGRLALWSALFGLLYVLRARVEMWGVAVGVTCVLAALAAVGIAGGDWDRRKE